MSVRAWLLLAVGLVCATTAWADVIRIKNSGTFNGKVLKKTEKEIVVQFDFGTMSFLPNEVEVIQVGELSPTAQGLTHAEEPASAKPPAPSAAAPEPAASTPEPEQPVMALQDALRAVAFIAVQRQDGKVTGGSGTIINEHGVLLTNYHVVGGAAKILVMLPEGQPKNQSKEPKTYDASVVKSNPYYDLAILEIHAKTPHYLHFAEDDTVQVGNEAKAIGNPQGLTISVSKGIVSAVRTNRQLGLQYVEIPGESMNEREFDAMTWIQTDAAVNPGNSGGPLLNEKNAIIGINSFIVSQSGGSVGLNFALHVKHLRKFVRGYAKL